MDAHRILIAVGIGGRATVVQATPFLALWLQEGTGDLDDTPLPCDIVPGPGSQQGTYKRAAPGFYVWEGYGFDGDGCPIDPSDKFERSEMSHYDGSEWEGYFRPAKRKEVHAWLKESKPDCARGEFSA